MKKMNKTKGKIMSVALAAVLAITAVPIISEILPINVVHAQELVDPVHSDFKYEDNGDGTATITGYTGSGGNVVIPEKLGGLTVTAIRDGSSNSVLARSGIKSIEIPSTMKYIGAYAFSNNDLTSVIIPEGVEHISNDAFSSNNLTSISLPETLTYIGDYAFLNNRLTEVTIPENVSYVGDRAFDFNGRRKTITIKGNLESVGSNAFGNKYKNSPDDSAMKSYTGGLKEVIIEDGVTSLPDGFLKGYSIINVNLPDSVKVIGDEAFMGSGLRDDIINIPDSITSMGDRAFADNNLTKAVFPEGMVVISDGLYMNNKIESITIPDGIISLGNRAFAGNLLKEAAYIDGMKEIPEGLYMDNIIESVTIPETITKINDNAFNNNNITGLVFHDNITAIGKNAFGKNKLTSVELPEKLVTIGDKAFDYNLLSSIDISNNVKEIGMGVFSNNQLTNITISSNITSIPDNAFANNKLSSITILKDVTAVGENAFSNNQINEVIVEGNTTRLAVTAFDGNQTTASNLLLFAPDPSIAKNFAETKGYTYMDYVYVPPVEEPDNGEDHGSDTGEETDPEICEVEEPSEWSFGNQEATFVGVIPTITVMGGKTVAPITLNNVEWGNEEVVSTEYGDIHFDLDGEGNTVVTIPDGLGESTTADTLEVKVNGVHILTVNIEATPVLNFNF